MQSTTRSDGRPRTRSMPLLSAKIGQISIAAELDEPFVADPEVVGHLVPDDVAHLAAQQLCVGSVQALERAAVDRDLVRQRALVAARAPRQRHSLVQAEERHTGGWFLLHDDGHVRHRVAELAREIVERIAHRLLEVEPGRIAHAAVAPASASTSATQRPHVRATPQSGVETMNAVPTAPQRAPLDGSPLVVSARWTTPSLPITAHSPGPNGPRIERTATGTHLSSPQEETATPSMPDAGRSPGRDRLPSGPPTAIDLIRCAP